MYSHSPSVSSCSGSFRFSSAEPEGEGETLIAVNGGLGLWVHQTSHSLTPSLWLREALSHGACSGLHILFFARKTDINIFVQ